MTAFMEKTAKSCFFVAPIGVPKSDVRDRSDKILRYLVRPTVEELGYSVQRADEIDEPGLITSQIIRRVVSDDLVIADLTGGNPNVFYELAVRHASQKPFIQLIDSKEKIPFDIANTRTIHVDHTDLISVDEAREAMKKQIKKVEKSKHPLENPLTSLLRLNIPDGENITIGSVYERLSEMEEAIRQDISDVELFPDHIEVPGYEREFREIYDMLYDIRHQIALTKK
ncbi:hypothetical protein C5748_06965 [Phyllobacterium phragmitis]|uniref:Nucleoside 2-deoxyribosyltransferase n=1 Tax=Phyllobacterium phragmitis TaxID=2670329 RepID=A0A2S9IUV5_9HYPH|nr:hypothetical protein [Phyllobacterium phragmitis]PRD44322.1 hypothetical protein C5748_06965 [Phyllobacterium phragmitis]